MGELLHFEKLNVGDVFLSPRRTITESDIVNFAGMTGDFNPLHVDHEHASETAYGRPIAHGLLGLAWVAGLGSNSPCVNTRAFVCVRDWKFLRPLYIGDTVHVETEVIETRKSGRKSGHVSWRRRLVNQHGETTQDGVFETLVAIENVVVEIPSNLDHIDSSIEQSRSIG